MMKILKKKEKKSECSICGLELKPDGKCPACKEKKKKLYYGVCFDCHKDIGKQARTDARNEMPKFIG